MINVKDYSAMGNGVANDRAAVKAALNAGADQSVFFPSGRYRIEMGPSDRLRPLYNTVIYGEGKGTVLEFEMTAAALHTFFVIRQNGVTFKDLKIEFVNSIIGATVIGFHWEADDLVFDNVEIDGGVVGGSSLSHLFHLMKPAKSGSFHGLTVRNCYWHDVTRCWLRPNTDTAIIRNLRFRDSRFERAGSGMFAFNAPNGLIQGVKFIGNDFSDPYIGTINQNCFCIGPQVTNCVISGNTFEGIGNECLHLEERAKNIVIGDNIIDMHVKRGIYVSDNKVGGSFVSPTNVIIGNNTIIGAGTGNGIELVNDGGAPAVDRGLLDANIITGWQHSIRNVGNAPVVTTENITA